MNGVSEIVPFEEALSQAEGKNTYFLAMDSVEAADRTYSPTVLV
jgi:hypothetical protein